MFFTKKIKKLVLNNFNNCQIMLINEKFNKKKLSSPEIKIVQKGDTVFIDNTVLPLGKKDNSMLNITLNIAEIEDLTIKNSKAYIFNSGDASLLEPTFNFENSKIVFSKIFKEKIDINLSNSEVSIYGGSFIYLANFKVLNNSTILMNDIYIDELDVHLSDRNDVFDKSKIETYQNSFIRKAHLKVASKSRAVLNVLQSTKIDNISFKGIVLRGNSYITGHNYNYSKNDTILTPFKVKDTTGMIVLPLYFLKKYTLPTPESVLNSFKSSKATLRLNLPDEIKIDLKREKLEKLERFERSQELKKKFKEQELNFKMDKKNNKKVLNSVQKETDLAQIEAEASFYRSQGIVPKKQKIANWNTDNMDFDKLFKILNMSDLTDAITSENKSYIVESIKRTIKENTKLNKHQQENRKKLCYLYGIKELRLEVEF